MTVIRHIILIAALLVSFAAPAQEPGKNYKQLIKEATQKFEETKRQLGSEMNAECATLLGSIADYYSELGNVKAAIEYESKAMNIRKKVLGNKHPDYAISLGNLADFYSDLGDYAKAIELGTEAMEIRKEVLGNKHPDYALSLNWLAYYYSDLGEYAKAIELGTEAMEINKEVLGTKHPDYAISLSNLANYYSDLGDYAKAIELGTEAIEICKQVLGTKHPDYATSLNNLAWYYSDLGDYAKAIELGTEAMEIRKDVLGNKHHDYATSLNNLANYYFDLGEYAKAIELGTETSEIYKQVLGANHPYYATSLNNLARYYSFLGNFAKAIELGAEALEIRKDVLGNKHPDYATSLNNLAWYYYRLGDYAKAIELGNEAMEIHKQVLGTKHPDYATSLNNLASYYYCLGDYAKAIELGTEAIEIRKQVLGTKHPNYAISLGNLAKYYSHLGDYAKAIELGTERSEICKQVLGTKHPDYAISLGNLANYYSHLGDYAKAIELGTEAMEIRKDVLGNKHPSYANSLNNLASFYSYLGDYAKAIEVGTEAMDICKDVLGNKHPDYATSLSNLARYYSDLGDYAKAIELMDRCCRVKKDNLLSTFQGTASRQRQSYWKENYYLYIFWLPRLANATQNKEYYGSVYDNSALFAKGLLLNAETSLRSILLESGDSDVLNRYDEWQRIIMALNKQREMPIKERTLNCDSLENISQQMERELMKSSKAFGDFTRNLTVTWKDVQAGLKDDDMAIEFLAFPDTAWQTKYVALTLKKGYDMPKMIEIFAQSQLDSIPKEQWYTSPELCNLVWGPLQGELEDVKNVYFSPAGALYNIGIEHLPCTTTENIAERYSFFRLSSTRELAITHDTPQANTSALYGGLKYYVPSEDLLAYNREKGYTRSADSRDSRDILSPLPETRTEVENISSLLRTHGYEKPELHMDEEGTEESFKHLSGKRTRIIHLATHGSYITPSEAEKMVKRRKRMSFIQTSDQRSGSGADTEDESLTRSYLAMSGGKLRWTSDSIRSDVDDGLLTAQEIAHVDLRGCDLAVLSACQTALGDITSEGVMGLQRGFKKAGVQSIVMSLWKVADKPTQEFMTEFYRHLTAGESKRASFLAAQKWLKEKYPVNMPGDRTSPPYWAAFILLDPEAR